MRFRWSQLARFALAATLFASGASAQSASTDEGKRIIRWAKNGVDARWVKDRGFAVTWHGSEGAARKAAAAPYGWDRSTGVVGVFPVQA